jgi:putative protease
MIELLAPAGNLEKMKFAFAYGADAVYLGGPEWSLRSRIHNFSLLEIAQAAKIAHQQKRKIYITLNIFAHNRDIEKISPYIHELESTGIDAVIISDPGLLAMVQSETPSLKIHLSTQANTTNWRSASFWQNLGVKRIVLARELTLEEIKEIRSRTTIELEIFVHGAMCMSYSGRCLISSYLTGRSANQGDCTHPCRWEYSLVEKERPGEFFQVEEDGRGTYFFNSKDLNLLAYLPEILKSGVTSLKIEGRNKSTYYVANVVRVYRTMLDAYLEGRELNQLIPNLERELNYVSHRPYATGFIFNTKGTAALNQESSSYIRESEFLGIITEVLDKGKNKAKVAIRGKFVSDDVIQVMGKKIEMDFMQQVGNLVDIQNQSIEFTKPNSEIPMIFKQKVEVGDILRKINS